MYCDEHGTQDFCGECMAEDSDKRIAELEAENERLREALITIQNYQQNAVGDLYPAEILADIVKIALKALKGGSDE